MIHPFIVLANKTITVHTYCERERGSDRDGEIARQRDSEIYRDRETERDRERERETDIYIYRERER